MDRLEIKKAYGILEATAEKFRQLINSADKTLKMGDVPNYINSVNDGYDDFNIGDFVDNIENLEEIVDYTSPLYQDLYQGPISGDDFIRDSDKILLYLIATNVVISIVIERMYEDNKDYVDDDIIDIVKSSVQTMISSINSEPSEIEAMLDVNDLETSSNIFMDIYLRLVLGIKKSEGNGNILDIPLYNVSD